MFGIPDIWISLPFLFCILSAGLCVVYGVLNWNRDGVATDEAESESSWQEEERRIEEQL